MNQLHDMFYIVTNKAGYSYPHGIWKRSLRGSCLSPTAAFWALYAESRLMHGNHTALQHIQNRHPIVRYYLAWSLYFRGKFTLCLDELTVFIKKFPEHYEARFLLADCLTALQRKKEAFEILKNLLFRKKSWIKLSSLVDTSADFNRLESLFNNAAQQGIVKNTDPIVLEHIAMGAQRCGLYDRAISIWEKMSLCDIKYPYKPKPRLNSEHAREALCALQEECEKKDILLFLISGTLLGLIRHNGFLSHDTDLDTGIFEGFSQKSLREAIHTAGCFSIMPQRTPHCLRIRHANGTPIDIFTHYKNENDYWHGGVKVSWHNSPFNLKRIEFLGINIYIPDDPEKYLEENYGKGWRAPVSLFDSALDCPNSRIENEHELHIHKLKKHLSKMR